MDDPDTLPTRLRVTGPRHQKPHKYAAAGIRHFWLVETEGDDHHPVVRVYELDPVDKAYTCSGTHRDRLKPGVPFDIAIDIDIAIDLTEFDER